MSHPYREIFAESSTEPNYPRVLLETDGYRIVQTKADAFAIERLERVRDAMGRQEALWRLSAEIGSGHAQRSTVDAEMLLLTLRELARLK